MLRSRFTGVGAALPSAVVGNAEIEARLGVEPGWIAGRTGVRERRVVRGDETVLDLTERAARAALAAAGIAPGSLDAIVVATTSAPYLFPSLACLLHARLGLPSQPAFDVAAACAGFAYALTVADQAIRAGDHRRVLVVGADCLSTVCEPSDRMTAPLFGDGAGAVVLVAEDTAGEAPRGILAARLRALGSQWEMLYVAAGRRRAEDFAAPGADPWMRMRGQEVFRFAVEQLVDLTRAVLDASGLSPDDVALLVPHQANLRIIRMMLTQLGVPESRVCVDLEQRGNTSAASIPLALCTALEQGRLHPGDVVVLNAVGGGMTAGALVARW